MQRWLPVRKRDGKGRNPFGLPKAAKVNSLHFLLLKKTRIIEPRTRMLELPLVRSGTFLFFRLKLGLRRSVFAVVSPTTVRTRIPVIGPCARTLNLPLLVRSGIFFLFSVSGQIFSVFFALFQRRKFRAT